MSDRPKGVAPTLGAIVLGRYRILHELARGGMGVVYLARVEGAVGFLKPVVVKLILPEHAQDPRFLGMFVREAKILAQLRHPSIVDVLEFGEQDGAYVMVLEYVRGYTLSQWHQYLVTKGRTIPVPMLLQVMSDVLEALNRAHTLRHSDGSSMHVVHRDVSPSNVMLDEDGRARLLDFGVARVRGTGDYQTQVKSFVGKLTYSAPELFSGAEATPTSDLYSCAVVLHEMLVGRNVFRGKTQAESLNLSLHYRPDLVEPERSDVPRGLDAVLQRALAKLPEQRFESAAEFAAALRALQSQPESRLRDQLGVILRQDFGAEMASLLGLESLDERDAIWRRVSSKPPRSEVRDTEVEVEVDARPTRPEQPISPPPRRGLHAVPPPGAPSNGTPRPITSVPQPPPLPRMDASGHPESTRPVRRGKLRVALLASAAALLLVAGFAGATFLDRDRADSAPPPRFTVLTTKGAKQGANPPAIAPAPVAQGAPVDAAKKPARRGADKRPEPARPDALALTRAVRREQPRIEACFKKHTPVGSDAPSLELDFDLDTKGIPRSVRVSPQHVSASETGVCVLGVAKSVRFAPPGEPVSFTIPIRATRE